MFIWTKNKIILVVISVLLIFAGIFVYYNFIPKASVSVASIEASGSRFFVGEEFSAVARLSDWKNAGSISIVVDGKLFDNCLVGSSCKFSFVAGPSDIGDHEYVFVATDKNGKVDKKSGQYTIISDSPELKSLTTNGNQIPVGGSFFVKLDASSAAPITSAKLFIDGALAQTCNVMPCIAQIGALTAQDVGDHIFSFEVINGKNKSITPGGTFTVTPVSKDNKNNPQNNVSSPEIVDLKISKKEVVVGDVLTVNILAKDQKGIMIIMLFIDGKYVGGCDESPSCSISIADFNNTNIGSHKYKVLVINKDGKSVEAEGSFSVIPQKTETGSSAGSSGSSSGNLGSTPVPPSIVVVTPSDDKDTTASSISPSQPNQSPVIQPVTKSPPQIEYITSGGNKLAVGETFTSKIVVKDELGIEKITGYIDGNIVSTCNKLLSCAIKMGPLTDKNIGEHNYLYIVKNISGLSVESSGKFTVYKPASGALPIIPIDLSIFNNPEIFVVPTLVPMLLFPTSTTEAKTPPLWIDTDGGIKEFTLGKCMSNVVGALYQKVLPDSCVDKEVLNEYYLDEKADKCLSKKITCENLCYGGICFAPGTRPGAAFDEKPAADGASVEPPPPPVWIDTDGGINESVVGKCMTNIPGAYAQKATEDFCIDASKLNEYYLDSKADKCLVQIITCTGSCNSGMCISAPISIDTGYNNPNVISSGGGSTIVIPTVNPTILPTGVIPVAPVIQTIQVINPVAPIIVSPSWEDTDGGNYPNVYGECRSLKYATQKIAPDYCLDRSNLIEYYIDAGGASCLQSKIACANGCAQGKCIVLSTRPVTNTTIVPLNR